VKYPAPQPNSQRVLSGLYQQYRTGQITQAEYLEYAQPYTDAWIEWREAEIEWNKAVADIKAAIDGLWWLPRTLIYGMVEIYVRFHLASKRTVEWIDRLAGRWFTR